MALIIRSGNGTTDEATVDPTSKALRITEYKADGNYGWLDNLPTYSAFCTAFTPPATPTDVFSILGSASKTIAILRAMMSTVQTTAGVNAWYLAKRSTAYTGGVAVAATGLPHDSADAAPSAVAQWWTTLFTGGGSLVGNYWAGRINSPAPATAGIGGILTAEVDFVRLFGKPLILRGVGQSLSWNFLAVALPAGLSVLAGFTWVEY